MSRLGPVFNTGDLSRRSRWCPWRLPNALCLFGNISKAVLSEVGVEGAHPQRQNGTGENANPRVYNGLPSKLRRRGRGVLSIVPIDGNVGGG